MKVANRAGSEVRLAHKLILVCVASMLVQGLRIARGGEKPAAANVRTGTVTLEFDPWVLAEFGIEVSTRADAAEADGGPKLETGILPGGTIDLNVNPRDGAQMISGALETRGAILFISAANRAVIGNPRIEISSDGTWRIYDTLHGMEAALQPASLLIDHPKDMNELRVAAELSVTPAFAAKLGVPELAGNPIGRMLIDARLGSGADQLQQPADQPIPPDAFETASIGPDVIVGDLHEVASYGTLGGIAAFSVGTTSCNIGDFWLNWNDSTNQHPVIGGNMFRLKSGRFEQVGQSWLKHGFFALSQNLCFSNCQGTDGSHLGVHCSDPYSASLNGTQSNLGPKYQVNPSTGSFPYPPANPSYSGNIARRLQVKIPDLDPNQDGGGQYFVEGQYVTPDDAAAGNQNNNASWRPIGVSGGGSNWNIALSGTTHRQECAIRAWKANDPQVLETNIQVPSDGLYILSAKATALGAGFWHYEYAIQNMNSNRAARSFSIPIDPTATVQSIGFHDVDYHSGEPFVGTDWNGVFSNGMVTWSTQDFNTNQNANALRWGTLYNFRFDANRQPQTVTATLELFRSGTPAAMSPSTIGPTPTQADCNHNGIPDTIDLQNGTSPDCDGDGRPDECQFYGIAAQQVFNGLDRPNYLTASQSDPTHVFIVEQAGRIRVARNGVLLFTPFMDITSRVSSTGENGLLSLAFPPDYATGRHFYVSYTDVNGNFVIARYTTTANAEIGDPNSEVILETFPQDGADHHGGQLQFAADGTLYVGTGDGGSLSDPLNHGQDTGSLLGKILRLDVNNPPTYVFDGNPFLNPGLPLDEIWAYGLRDPWRFSLDRETDDLYIADIGQTDREEIDYQPASSNGGEDYGWRCMEGSHCTGLTGCTCNAAALTSSVLEYPHPAQGCARVIGGYAYRGCQLPNMLGTYFYADFCSGEIHSFRMVNGQVTEQNDRTAQLTPPGGPIQSIISFGEDADGELYIVSRLGSIYKIVRTSFCGNNILEAGEECDDGNNISGDGCSADCHIEVGPANDDCVNAKPTAEARISFEILDATTDGPNESAACGVSAAAHPLGSDIWFCYTPTCTGTATATMCNATNFDSMVAVYDGCTCPSGPAAIACVNDSSGCGTDASVSFPVTACESRLIRIGGFNGSIGTGTLSITCAPHAVVTDCNNNGVEDAADIACGTLTDSNSNGIPDLCEANGNEIRGGRLYDTWWQEAGVVEPSTDHPLWQYRPDMVSDIATGSTTWSCTECHGWDYLGASGQYASGPQHTGFGGIRGTQLSGAALFDLLKQPPSNGGGAGVLNGHDYGSVISDNDIHDLVAFVLLGTVDSSSYINPSNGVFLGDPVQGGTNYTVGGTQTHCVSCHGGNGTAINFGTPTNPEFLGTTAVSEPFVFLHRARMGYPGGAMMGWRAAGGTDQGAADIGRYAQLNFATECANDSQCNDGIACTVDSCNAQGRCAHNPDSGLCTDDNVFCDGPEACDPALGCVSLGNPCGNPADCNETADSCGCNTPVVSAPGPRYLSILPQSNSPNVTMSFLVTPTCSGGVAKYVSAPSGPNNVAYLVDSRSEAAVLTPAQWGSVVLVSGVDVAPGVTYGVQADCGGASFPSLTQAVEVSTPVWGDVVGMGGASSDGVANIIDVAAVVDGFRQLPTAKPLAELDLYGCVPNQKIDVADLAGAVDAFKGRSYLSSLCPGPCW